MPLNSSESHATSGSTAGADNSSPFYIYQMPLVSVRVCVSLTWLLKYSSRHDIQLPLIVLASAGRCKAPMVQFLHNFRRNRSPWSMTCLLLLIRRSNTWSSIAAIPPDNLYWVCHRNSDSLAKIRYRTSTTRNYISWLYITHAFDMKEVRYCLRLELELERWAVRIRSWLEQIDTTTDQ